MSTFSSSSEISQESKSTPTSSTKDSKRKSCYDVYLSFSAKDIPDFILKLHTALRSYVKESLIFIDDKKLESRDQEITPSESTLSIIEECKIAVVIFSRNYTNSRSCLQELEKITQCCRTSTGLIVLPVLYPLHPGLQAGTFGAEAFHDFLKKVSKKEISQKEDKIMTWVAEISKATQYPNEFDPTDTNEYDCIKSIVGRVICALYGSRDFSCDIYTSSVKSGVQDVIELLKQSTSPLLLGIWGMAGTGKTTIAKTIYDQIGPYFEDKCLLGNVWGDWKQNNGQVSLQEKLLSYFVRLADITVPTIETGRMIIKKYLQNKRVLLILDNVDKLEQLEALCGNPDWFGPGSKIIITTRDRHLIKKHGFGNIHPVKALDDRESLELLNCSAFSQATSPPKEFVELSRQLVAYCGGLPLALKGLGGFLRGKDPFVWKGALRSLESFSFPGQNVIKTLEMSFDDLSGEEKELFLDIAYFFIGMSQNDALQTLNSSTQYCTARQISLLEDKCLVTIDENNKLGMHILLQAMARGIIKRESSNKTNQPKMYDVFLSFRGDDSRAKFVSHLHSSLQNAAIHVFKDDDEIERGDQISISLLRAIGRSKISVVVLSINYANSRWCMLELEKIMEICRSRGLVVVPVFYEVDPSEVRHQKGQFGKGFDNLITKISVDESTKSNWRRDLTDIGGTAGFVLIDSRNESADINNIVGRVTRLLDGTKLFVAEHPVGVESRVQAATKLLNIQKLDDVLLLGIWGMGGTGKTTVAKAIYNQIGRKFEGRSFLLGIREFWETHTNQVSLQQQVLCDVYKTTTFKIQDIESGKNTLKERLSQNRVLFVLDDVDELDQLKALCGSREWFGPGSRIIITTRNIDILTSCGVDRVYTVKEMEETESLELFSWHAFKQPNPTEEFTTHSTNVIAYSGRLPLALEVIGSYLSKCEITEWQRVLEKLKCIPHDEVQKKLRVSFDGLKDATEQQIFLDIACFFIGMDKKDVIQILNGCGFFADIGIKVLVERSLVTVDNENKLRMHDLLRDMGRQIIYEESPFDSEKRSRLWRHDEVFDILSKHKGTEAVKGLALEFPRNDCLKTKAFKKMNKLRLLRLAGVKLNGDFKYLSGDLRWLYWHGFPETCIPAEFQQESLVVIELKYSKLKQIWNMSQMLENLKFLNLSHSLDLIETPNFSCLPNLEKLVLKDCPSLSAVSHSIKSLHKLLLLDLTDCTGLRKLPRNVYKLKSLETLILSGCSMIDKLEEDIEQMESLTTLIADKTAITKVPFSIVRLKSIGYISLRGFEGFSRDVFPSLIRSWMSPSNNVISLIQTSTPISSVGAFKDLLKLRILCVECGSDLQLTEDVARLLDVLKVTNCQNLEEGARSTTSEICNIDCTLGSKNYLKSLIIQMGTKCQVSNIAEDSVLQTADGTWDSFLLSCDNNSKRLTFSSNGCSIIFDLPTMKVCNLKSMMLFVVYYSSLENIISDGFQGVLIINYTKRTVQVYKRDTLTSFEDVDWQSITSNLEPGNMVKVMVVFGEGFAVEKTTVSLLYDKPIEEEDVIVYGDEHNNVCAYGGDNIDVPADVNVTGPGQDENISEDKHRYAVNDSAIVSGDDVMESNKNHVVSGCENVHDDKKNWDAVDKNVIVSGDVDKNAVGNKNVFRGLFTKLPSLVCVILMSRPFWSSLVGILVWITFRHFKKGRSPKLLTRYTRRGNWLVDFAQKVITYKKANKACSVSQS